MKKIKARDFATSFSVALFLIVGVSGVLMFFHLFDKYTKNLHEILGLLFVAIIFAHIWVNWKSMRGYFTKKIFALALFLTFLVTLGFVVDSDSKGENPKIVILHSMLKAPMESSLKVLGIDEKVALLKLQESGVSLDKKESIDIIAKYNNRSPFEIVSIMINQ